jgi:hypothetical protein
MERSRSSAFIGLLCSLLSTAACSSGEGPAAAEAGPEPADTGTDRPDPLVEDAFVADADAPTPDAPRPPDARVDAPADAPSDTVADAPPTWPYGRAPIDETCQPRGNFATGFEWVQRSPDGKQIVFQRCDAARSVVRRDLVTGQVATVTTGDAFFVAMGAGIVATRGATTERTPWSEGAPIALPIAVPPSAVGRIFQSATAMKYAEVVSGASASRQKIRIHATDAATIETAEYEVARATITSTILSADGGTVATLERYSSELGSRLRVAPARAGAAVTTHDLRLFEPRWVEGGQVAGGALFLSGMNGTQRASALYFVDFATGVVTQLSTADVIPSKPPRESDLPGVAVVGDRVFFLTGAVSSNSSSPVGKRVAVGVWNARTPSEAPTVHTQITDAEIYALASATKQKRTLVVTPDRSHLLLNLVAKSGTIFGNAWAAVPVAGGPAKFVAATSSIEVAPPARVGAQNYQETDTKFVDVSSGVATSMPRDNPLFSPTGDVFFTYGARENGDGTDRIWVSRKVGAAPASRIVDLPRARPFLAPLAVLDSSVVLRLQRGQPADGEETKFDLYLFP